MSLTANYTFVGEGNWSLDAVGGRATNGGVVSAIVPEGSEVEAAFLYGSTFISGIVNSVTIARGADSRVVTDFDALGVSGPFTLQAYRADVTAFIRGVVDDGDAAAFDFNISGISGTNVDGFALVVVYSNPDEDTRTIALLDGFSDPDGDAFSLSFDEPVNTDQEGFEAQFSLGIGFGAQPGNGNQSSQVTVDGRRLTSSAGGPDDGTLVDGGLITIGGIGDSTANVTPNTDGNLANIDDELYDLAQGNDTNATPFLADGATGISVTTLNPSDDDNIFFAGFNITAVVAVDTGENDAPVAVGDDVTVDEDDTVTFNVLGNDFDPDEGDEFNITSFDTSALAGILTDNGDGSFTYDPNDLFNELGEGEEATTSFSYTISDGEESATTTVTITVEGQGDGPGPSPSDCPTVDRPGTQEGSASSNQVLAGPAYHNSFYFDNAAGSTGDDGITLFGKDDILVVTESLRDSNGDGIINFGFNGVLDLGGGDSVDFANDVTSLRYLGEACENNFVYADARVRPDGATEGLVLSGDVLEGDDANSATDIFFFDTALDLDLGDDTITNFGSGDVLVTTTQIRDGNGDGRVGFGPNAVLDLPGGVGGPGDPGAAGEGGSVTVVGPTGESIEVLEYDGSITEDGVTYYVYSRVGSSVGVEALG